MTPRSTTYSILGHASLLAISVALGISFGRMSPQLTVPRVDIIDQAEFDRILETSLSAAEAGNQGDVISDNSADSAPETETDTQVETPETETPEAQAPEDTSPASISEEPIPVEIIEGFDVPEPQPQEVNTPSAPPPIGEAAPRSAQRPAARPDNLEALFLAAQAAAQGSTPEPSIDDLVAEAVEVETQPAESVPQTLPEARPDNLPEAPALDAVAPDVVEDVAPEEAPAEPQAPLADTPAPDAPEAPPTPETPELPAASAPPARPASLNENVAPPYNEPEPAPEPAPEPPAPSPETPAATDDIDGLVEGVVNDLAEVEVAPEPTPAPEPVPEPEPVVEAEPQIIFSGAAPAQARRPQARPSNLPTSALPPRIQAPPAAEPAPEPQAEPTPAPEPETQAQAPAQDAGAGEVDALLEQVLAEGQSASQIRPISPVERAGILQKISSNWVISPIADKPNLSELAVTVTFKTDASGNLNGDILWVAPESRSDDVLLAFKQAETAIRKSMPVDLPDEADGEGINWRLRFDPVAQEVGAL